MKDCKFRKGELVVMSLEKTAFMGRRHLTMGVVTGVYDHSHLVEVKSFDDNDSRTPETWDADDWIHPSELAGASVVEVDGEHFIDVPCRTAMAPPARSPTAAETPCVKADGLSLVYVAAPYSGNIVENLEYVARAVRNVLGRGEIPYVPHFMFEDSFDDSVAAERDAVMRLCEAAVGKCDVLAVYGDRISHGMRLEIAAAEAAGVPTDYRHLPSSRDARFNLYGAPHDASLTAAGFTVVGDGNYCAGDVTIKRLKDGEWQVSGSEWGVATKKPTLHSMCRAAVISLGEEIVATKGERTSLRRLMRCIEDNVINRAKGE